MIALIILNVFAGSIVLKWFLLKDRIFLLNVGQGDSELIRTRAGNILIDAGPNSKVLEQLSNVMPFYDKTIDIIILSHPNADHLNGFLDVLKNYKVRAAVHTNTDFQLAAYRKFKQMLANQKIPQFLGASGLAVRADDTKLYAMWPDKNFLNKRFTNANINESSVIVLADFQGKTALFTGDITDKTEQILASRLEKIDVLKVSHHGSKYASSEIFLAKIKPRYSIIEVGKNNYGHPTREALSRLEKFSRNILRTDLNGLVICELKTEDFYCF